MIHLQKQNHLTMLHKINQSSNSISSKLTNLQKMNHLASLQKSIHLKMIFTINKLKKINNLSCQQKQEQNKVKVTTKTIIQIMIESQPLKPLFWVAG